MLVLVSVHPIWCDWGICSVATEREAQSDKVDEENSHKEDNSTSGLEHRGVSNDNNDEKLEEVAPEKKSQSAKEQDDKVSLEEVGTDKPNKSNNSELPTDQSPTLGKSDDSKVEAPPSSVKEPGEGASVGKHSEPMETPMDVDMSDSIPSTKTDTQQGVASNSVEQATQSTEASKEVDVSKTLASERDEPPSPITVISEEPQPTDTSKDVDMVCDTQPPQENEPP